MPYGKSCQVSGMLILCRAFARVKVFTLDTSFFSSVFFVEVRPVSVKILTYWLGCNLKLCLCVQGLSAAGCPWVHALSAGPPPQGAPVQSERGISPSPTSGWGQTVHRRGQMLHVGPSNHAVILCFFGFQLNLYQPIIHIMHLRSYSVNHTWPRAKNTPISCTVLNFLAYFHIESRLAIWLVSYLLMSTIFY